MGFFRNYLPFRRRSAILLLDASGGAPEKVTLFATKWGAYSKKGRGP